MPKVFTSKTQKRGELGETLACRYLNGHEFAIIERNYTRKWGEIDIIAEKGGVLCFFEVKSLDSRVRGYSPLQNMHFQKIARLRRCIQTYLVEKQSEHREWRFGVVTVSIDELAKKGRVVLYDDLVI